MLHGKGGTAGVDWSKAVEIGRSLLFSPLIGFGVAALLFLAMKLTVLQRGALSGAEGRPAAALVDSRLADLPPCTGVSFFHGSNDGQKGMGLIMLILIGTVPTAYALNRAVPPGSPAEFHRGLNRRARSARRPGRHRLGRAGARDRHPLYRRQAVHARDGARARRAGRRDRPRGARNIGSLAKVPAEAVDNIRNDMCLSSEAIKLLTRDPEIAPADTAKVAALDEAIAARGTPARASSRHG